MEYALDTLGAGEPIAGYPTRHYRVTGKYTMNMDMRGFDAFVAVEQEPEATHPQHSWHR